MSTKYICDECHKEIIRINHPCKGKRLITSVTSLRSFGEGARGFYLNGSPVENKDLCYDCAVELYGEDDVKAMYKEENDNEN